MNKLIIFFLLILMQHPAFSQDFPVYTTLYAATGPLNYRGIPREMNSPNAVRTFTSLITNSDEAQSKMLKMDVNALFDPWGDRTGGLIADVDQVQAPNFSSVRLKVWSYNPANGGEKGELLYEVYTKTSTFSFG